MRNQYVRRSLAGSFQHSMKIVCDILSGLSAGSRIAPHHTRATISARASGPGDRVVNGIPAQGPVHVESGFEHHRWCAGPATIELDFPGTDVDQFARRRKIPGGGSAAKRFVARADQDYYNDDGGECEYD